MATGRTRSTRRLAQPSPAERGAKATTIVVLTDEVALEEVQPSRYQPLQLFDRRDVSSDSDLAVYRQCGRGHYAKRDYLPQVSDLLYLVFYTQLTGG